MRKEIKKGDKVKVLDTFEVYETYSEMFEKLGFKNTKKNIANENCCDVVWNVVEILKHPKHNIELAFIKTEVSELLIKVSAIELVESSNTYQLTKEQILAIAENPSLVKELFPDCFEEDLITEVKKRGYKKDVVIKNHQGVFVLDELDLVFSKKPNYGVWTRQGYGVWLIMNGTWAEIITTPNDVIKVIETYRTDKLLTFIEAYDNSNSK